MKKVQRAHRAKACVGFGRENKSCALYKNVCVAPWIGPDKERIRFGVRGPLLERVTVRGPLLERVTVRGPLLERVTVRAPQYRGHTFILKKYFCIF